MCKVLHMMGDGDTSTGHSDSGREAAALCLRSLLGAEETFEARRAASVLGDERKEEERAPLCAAALALDAAAALVRPLASNSAQIHCITCTLLTEACALRAIQVRLLASSAWMSNVARIR